MATMIPGYTSSATTELAYARAARKARMAERNAARAADPELARKAKHFTPPKVANRTSYDYMTEPSATHVIELSEQAKLTAEGSKTTNFIKVDETLVDVIRSAGGRMLVRKNFSRALVKPEIVTPITRKQLPLKIELDAKFKVSYPESKGSNTIMQYVDVYLTYTGATF